MPAINTFITQILPVVMYLILHFGLSQKIFKKSNLKLLITLLLLACIYIFICVQLYSSFKKIDPKLIVTILPLVYLLNGSLFRYIFFNRLFTKKTYPYDPIIVYPGVFSANWE